MIDSIVSEHNSQGADFLFANQKGVGDFTLHTSSDGCNTCRSQENCFGCFGFLPRVGRWDTVMMR